MSQEIIHTKPGDTNFHLFEDVLKIIYPGNSIRHMQKESINREFLENCYVLLVDGTPQARAALYNNPDLASDGIKAWALGNYESVYDNAIASSLINFIAVEANRKGVTVLIGPMNGSTWDDHRFSIHHDTPAFFAEPYHHLYYNEQFTDNGFKVIQQYTSSIDNEVVCDHPYVLKKEIEFKEKGVTIRNIRIDDYENELKKLYPFILTVFSKNFLYTAVTWETFLDKYIEAASFINPEYVLIAENNQQGIIGFIFSYDDLFNKTEKSLVVKTIAREQSPQWSGLGHVIANRVMRLVKNRGYLSVIHAFVAKEANSVNLSNNFLGNIYKNYVLYQKEI